MQPEAYVVLRSPGEAAGNERRRDRSPNHGIGVAPLGVIDSVSLAAQVIADSTHGGLAPAFDAVDAGSGMVQAPAGG